MMRRRFPLAILAALALAVVIIPGASTSSSFRSADKDDVLIIRVTAITVQDTFLDLGEPGESLGDQSVFSQDLFRQGNKVGTGGVVCTLVRVEPGVSATVQCVGTAKLRSGQITVQGLVTFTDGPSRFRVAITGGTGRFRTAHGVAIVEEISGTRERITFRIIR
jgi:hypothetical protein